MYTTAEGARIPMSLLGALLSDNYFCLPKGRCASAFPHQARTDSTNQQSLSLVACIHLCQCSRLVYEDADIIQDVVDNRWVDT